MKILSDFLADLSKFEADLKQDAETLGNDYQLGITEEFSPIERITGHLFNVCPYTFPYPLPGSIIDLRPLFNPIRDQGDEGACIEFAGCGFREYLRTKSSGQQCPVLSPADLYYNCRWLPMFTKFFESEDNGSTARTVIKNLKRKGVCVESLMPYVPGQLSTAPSKAAKSAQAAFKLGKAWRVLVNDQDMMLRVLASGRPILLAITVWDSFETGGTNGVLTIPNTSTENYLGNHGVILVGADLTKKLWIIRNQWGTKWGDKGYAYMPFGYEQLWIAGWSADFC